MILSLGWITYAKKTLVWRILEIRYKGFWAVVFEAASAFLMVLCGVVYKMQKRGLI